MCAALFIDRPTRPTPPTLAHRHAQRPHRPFLAFAGPTTSPTRTTGRTRVRAAPCTFATLVESQSSRPLLLAEIRETLNNLILKSPQEWHTSVALPFVKIEGVSVEWDERAPATTSHPPRPPAHAPTPSPRLPQDSV